LLSRYERGSWSSIANPGQNASEAAEKAQKPINWFARREKINKKARFWRVIPLAIGIGIFVWLSTPNGASWIKNQSASSMAPLLIIVGGVLLVMFGLNFAGAWLTGFKSLILLTDAR